MLTPRELQNGPEWFTGKMAYKRPFNQALVLFGLVCAYVSFLGWLFRFLCCSFVVIIRTLIRLVYLIA